MLRFFVKPSGWVKASHSEAEKAESKKILFVAQWSVLKSGNR